MDNSNPNATQSFICSKKSLLILYVMILVVPAFALCAFDSHYSLFVHQSSTACRSDMIWFASFLVFELWNLLCQIFVSWRLRKLDDAFDIKFEIKWVTIAAIFGILPFLVSEVLRLLHVEHESNYIRKMGGICVSFATCILGMWRPVIVSIIEQNNRRKRIKDNSGELEAYITFQESLRNLDVFNTFKNYLMTEFSVENLSEIFFPLLFF